MIDMEILALVAKIVGGLSCLAATAFAIYKYYIRRRKAETRWLNVIKDTGKIYDCLANILKTTGADRASIVMLHNGGKNPTLGKPLYESLMHESRSDRTVIPMKENIQRTLVDEQNIRLAQKLMLEKRISVTKDDISMENAGKWKAFKIESRTEYELLSVDDIYFYLAIDNPKIISDDIGGEIFLLKRLLS